MSVLGSRYRDIKKRNILGLLPQRGGGKQEEKQIYSLSWVNSTINSISEMYKAR